jgi:hypothetical protein
MIKWIVLIALLCISIEANRHRMEMERSICGASSTVLGGKSRHGASPLWDSRINSRQKLRAVVGRVVSDGELSVQHVRRRWQVSENELKKNDDVIFENHDDVHSENLDLRERVAAAQVPWISMSALQMKSVGFVPCYNGVSVRRAHSGTIARAEPRAHLAFVVSTLADTDLSGFSEPLGWSANRLSTMPATVNDFDGNAIGDERWWTVMPAVSCVVAVSERLARELRVDVGDEIELMSLAVVETAHYVHASEHGHAHQESTDGSATVDGSSWHLVNLGIEYNALCAEVPKRNGAGDSLPLLLGSEYNALRKHKRQQPLPVSVIVAAIEPTFREKRIGFASDAYSFLLLPSSTTLQHLRLRRDSRALASPDDWLGVDVPERSAPPRPGDAYARRNDGDYDRSKHTTAAMWIIDAAHKPPSLATDTRKGRRSTVMLSVKAAQELDARVGDTIIVMSVADPNHQLIIDKYEDDMQRKMDARERQAQHEREERERKQAIGKLWQGRDPQGWNKLYNDLEKDDQS